MAAIDRPADRGRRDGRRAIKELGEQLRLARVAAGLSQGDAGRACGVSYSKVGRIERDEDHGVSVVELAQLLAVVGLQLSARAYPHGSPSRDRAHGELLARLRKGLPAGIGWRTEVPLPNPGDLRAWDALVRLDGRRIGIEAETRPRDGQDLQRRLALKRRDGGVDHMILLLADTRSNRAFVREWAETFRADFPLDGRAALEALCAGRDPGGSAIILL